MDNPWKITVPAIFLGSVEHQVLMTNTDYATNFDDVRAHLQKCKTLFWQATNPLAGSDDIMVTIQWARTIAADGSGWCFEDNAPDYSYRRTPMELLRLWRRYESSCLNEAGELYVQYKKYETEHGRMDDGFFDGLSRPATQDWLYHVIVRRALERHQFVVTDNGYVGLVPRITSYKHILAIIAGARTPVILERVLGREELVLIGPCYIHGIMYGEACPALPGGSGWKTISLL
jgi:hypothetical protein